MPLLHSEGDDDSVQAPMTGRINLFTPFLPFTRIERAVLVHKYFLKIANDIRKPIQMKAKTKKLVRHCRLRIVDDSTVCCHLADKFYDKDMGARSLNEAVKKAREEFIFEYSNTDELVTEQLNQGPLKTYYVRRVPLGNDAYKFGAFAAIEERKKVMSELRWGRARVTLGIRSSNAVIRQL